MTTSGESGGPAGRRAPRGVASAGAGSSCPPAGLPAAARPAAVDSVAADPVTETLAGMLAWLGELAGCDAAMSGDPAGDAVRIDRIALLEKLKAVAGAAQGSQIVRFARSQVDAHLDARMDAPAVGRGIAEQIGLACKVSPAAGARRLGAARALWAELPATAALLRAGEVSEYTAGLVVGETRHLDAEARRAVDKQIVAAGVEFQSPRQAAATARRLAYQADPEGFLDRGRTERTNRRVGLRPAPDTMAYLTGFLPVEQGVACVAALRKHTDQLIGAGDGRTRDQIMADTLVERLTGTVAAADIDVEVGIVLPVEALLDPASTATAEVSGFGPIPARLARDILTGTRGRRWWRRLFTRGGSIVDGDPRRRRFDGVLADLIALRDGGRCRDPYCDAPIRHTDHIKRHRDHGPTSLANGRGVCARGNYVREMPGWQVEVTDDGLRGRPHTVRTTTPTGHTYDSQAPQPP